MCQGMSFFGELCWSWRFSTWHHAFELSLQAFIANLHAAGQRWVPILDPAIHVKDDYAAYAKGKEMDVWIKDITGQPYLGQVGPRPACAPYLCFLTEMIQEGDR